MTDRYWNSFEHVESGSAVDDELAAWVGTGPALSPTAATGRGFTGLQSLKFRHRPVERVRNAAFIDDRLEVIIHPDTEFSYLVFPESADGDPYAATAVALDLLFKDGSHLSQLDARDQHGTRVAAAEQGTSNTLVPDQWNRVAVNLGKVATGKVVVAVLLAIENQRFDTESGGWIDDIAIARRDPAGERTPADYVETRRGTNSSRDYSRGNTIPATALPNGFNFLVPMTDATSQKWLYEYARANNPENRPTLQALGLSHQPSPWMGDRNQLAIMPAAVGADGIPTDPTARALAFAHENEAARPYEYRVAFDSGIRAEMAPTMHGAIFRFDYPGQGAVIIDEVAGESLFRVTDHGELEGWVDGGTDLSVGRSRMYIVGRFSRPPRSAPRASQRPTALALTFGDDATRIDLRLASSFIGVEQARANLRELDGDYETIRDAARDAWNERLRVIEVDGATEDQLVTVYSNLYRLNLYPNWQHEYPAGDMDTPPRYASPVLPQDRSTDAETGAAIRTGTMAVNHGFWDTYRTVWPAYSLLYPRLAAELIDGFVQQYRDSGWIARWSSPGHADLMTGTNSDVAFADAILNGVPVADPFEVYEALLKSATVTPPSEAVGRKGAGTSAFLGYVPADIHESVSWTTENAINDFGIAALATHLSNAESLSPARRGALSDEAAYFIHRARNYRNLLDPATGFLRQRARDGRFPSAEGFDAEEWGGPYTETNAWTSAFHAPHDGAGLAALYGGPDAFAAKLDDYFATAERADKPGSYSRVIHEMVEARDVRMGQFGISNQPAHHLPYMYLYAGQPAKTQAIIREVLRRLFRGSDIGQGYPGDEDNGEMSAWYLFSALGFYPLALSSSRYAIGAPLFPTARVQLSDGAELVIEAEHHSLEHPFVQSVAFDGVPLTEPWIEHDRLATGGTLRFVMGPEPSRWGALPVEQAAAVGPLRDLTADAAITAEDGTDVAALVDDDAMTQVTFTSPTPAITISVPREPAAITMYTITNGDVRGAPASWTLEGFTGSSWYTIDARRDEVFLWPRQTRPFTVARPESYQAFRLTVHATADQTYATIAELELLSLVAPSDAASTP